MKPNDKFRVVATAKKYLNKYFKSQYINENDYEFKALVRLLNKAQKIRPIIEPEVKEYCSCNFVETTDIGKSKDGTYYHTECKNPIAIIRRSEPEVKEAKSAEIQHPKKKITVSLVHDLLSQVTLGKISYSRMVEILNERNTL